MGENRLTAFSGATLDSASTVAHHHGLRTTDATLEAAKIDKMMEGFDDGNGVPSINSAAVRAARRLIGLQDLTKSQLWIEAQRIRQVNRFAEMTRLSNDLRANPKILAD